jgi:hypothetical protein
MNPIVLDGFAKNKKNDKKWANEINSINQLDNGWVEIDINLDRTDKIFNGEKRQDSLIKIARKREICLALVPFSKLVIDVCACDKNGNRIGSIGAIPVKMAGMFSKHFDKMKLACEQYQVISGSMLIMNPVKFIFSDYDKHILGVKVRLKAIVLGNNKGLLCEGKNGESKEKKEGKRRARTRRSRKNA